MGPSSASEVPRTAYACRGSFRKKWEAESKVRIRKAWKSPIGLSLTLEVQSRSPGPTPCVGPKRLLPEGPQFSGFQQGLPTGPPPAHMHWARDPLPAQSPVPGRLTWEQSMYWIWGARCHPGNTPLVRRPTCNRQGPRDPGNSVDGRAVYAFLQAAFPPSSSPCAHGLPS